MVVKREAATFGGGRRLAILLNVLLMVALAFAAGGLLVYVTGFTDLKRRFDLTRTGDYTLSPETLRLLENLDREVEFVMVQDPSTYSWDVEQARPHALRYVADLLEEYKVRGRGLVAVERLDPTTDRDRVRDLYQQLGLREYNLVIVTSGKNRRVLSLDRDLADFDLGSPPPAFRPTRLIAFRGEEALSSALVEVTQDERPVVYALTGHGELALDQGGPDQGVLLAASLQRDNVEVRPLSLLATRDVPPNAAALLLLDPRDPFTADEKAALDGYLRRGGRLLVALDPLGDRSLDPLLEALGFALERRIVIDPASLGILHGAQRTQMFIGPGARGAFGRHAITAELAQRTDVVVVARSGGLAARDEAAGWYTSLLLSHPDAFGDVARDDGTLGDLRLDERLETTGQRTLAAALEPAAGPYRGARVALVFSVPWITNAFLHEAPGNDNFARRAVAWLTGRKQAIALAPRQVRANVAELRPEEYDAVFRYTALYMPAAALGLALLVWLARRR